MDWSTVTLAIIGSGILSSIIVAFANKDNQKADTFQKLALAVSSLTDDLNNERAARRNDNALFEQRITEMKNKYDAIIMELQERLSGLEVERNELLVENRQLRKAG